MSGGKLLVLATAAAFAVTWLASLFTGNLWLWKSVGCTTRGDLLACHTTVPPGLFVAFAVAVVLYPFVAVLVGRTGIAGVGA